MIDNLINRDFIGVRKKILEMEQNDSLLYKLSTKIDDKKEEKTKKEEYFDRIFSFPEDKMPFFVTTDPNYRKDWDLICPKW